MSRLIPLGCLLVLVGCTDPNFDVVSCKDVDTANCVEVLSETPGDLIVAVNSLMDDTTVVLGKGTFFLDTQVTIRSANGVTLRGQGMGETLLDFSAQSTQSNGVDAIGDDFSIMDLAVIDSVKDGVRVEDSTNVRIERVRVSWSDKEDTSNGGYGLYPVHSTNVLVAESEAFNASDAGLYVGQCINAVVRDNYARGNVAGIEVENTQYAEVYNNVAELNTGGMLIFDLPGNPIIGRDIKVYDNVVRSNNLRNFAPGGTVRSIPAGTGAVVLAMRRVEVSGNTFENNDTTDLAILSGLAIESNMERWALAKSELIGDYEDLGLYSDADNVYNFAVSEVWAHDNSFTASGTDPDGSDFEVRPLGFLIDMVYGETPVDEVIYDAIGESAFSVTESAGNSNDNHICVGEMGEATFASLDLETLGTRAESFDFGTVDDLYRPAAPFEPFNCEGFTAGAIPSVELPF